MASTLHHLLTVGVAGLAFSAGAAEARSPSGNSSPASMTLGPVSAPPPGFLEMCERTPQECLSTNTVGPDQLVEVRRWAGRTRWTAAFTAAGLLPAPAAPAGMAGPAAIPRLSAATPPAAVEASASFRLARSLRAPVKASASPDERRASKDAERKDAGRKGESRKPDVGQAGSAQGSEALATSAETAPVRPAPTPAAAPMATTTIAPSPIVLAAVTTDLLQSVNRRVNRAIRRASDADAFGREDLWVLPTGPRATGDCEDYVLAKRRALIEAGVAPAALSIAIVRTRRGETHAVLLVATEDGERVLDNLSPWVVRWDQAPYEWLERQAPGQALIWVQVAA